LHTNLLEKALACCTEFAASQKDLGLSTNRQKRAKAESSGQGKRHQEDHFTQSKENGSSLGLVEQSVFLESGNSFDWTEEEH
jgi:hypothetical protein